MNKNKGYYNSNKITGIATGKSKRHENEGGTQEQGKDGCVPSIWELQRVSGELGPEGRTYGGKHLLLLVG